MHQYIYVDSNKRNKTIYPAANSYILHLPDPIQNITRVDVPMVQIPNTIWNLSNTTSVITVNSTSYNLPPGFYTVSNLLTAINTAITASGVTATYIPAQGLVIFSSNADSFTVCTNFSDIQRLLGFPSTSTQSSVLSSGGLYTSYGTNIYLAPSVVEFSANEILFLDIMELRNPANQEAVSITTTNSGGFDGSTARGSLGAVPLNVNVGSIKTFEENTDYCISVVYPKPISKLTRLTIQWVNSSGQLVGWNGYDSHSFVLRIHYEESNRRITS
jgi:hypothetical protein